MLPQARRHFPRAWAVGAACVLAAVAACGPEATPEARVREMINAGERAAEARDLSGILEHVSPAFRDEQGRDRAQLGRYLRGYLVTHQSVQLLVRVEEVEFPYRDYARVRLTLGTLGREGGSAPGFDLAADLNDVVLELKLEDDAWKVVRAAWESGRRG